MNSFLDLAFSLITSPRKAMVVITNSEKLKEGFFFWIFVVLLMAISAFREGPGLILQFALLFLGMGTALLCHSAAIDYISGMWGGMGTAKGITAGFMAASLPLGFSVFFMLIGASGVTTTAITAHAGEVKVDGQVWEARSYDGSVEISAGESVEVLGLDGITLLVYPANRPLGR